MIVCVAAAILLLVAPQQPYFIVYSAGIYAVYPAIVLAVAAVVAFFLTCCGCCAVHCDSKFLLAFVSWAIPDNKDTPLLRNDNYVLRG